MELKDKLRKLRTEAGLSQEALADIIHISRSAIAKYENGNGKPSEETLKALAFYFGVEESELKSDEVVRKENKKRNTAKWFSRVCAVLLIVSIATLSVFSILNYIKDNEEPPIGDKEPPVSEQEPPVGEVESDLIGAYERVGVVYLNDSSCPIEQDREQGVSYYMVNTGMDFSITVFPKLKEGAIPILFAGNNAVFDKGYSDFASIHYDTLQKQTKYIVNFKKEGSFEIKYSIYGFERVIRFVCDNSYSLWTIYQKDLSFYYPWINTVAKNELVRIRYETVNGSLGPGAFRNIYYSTAKAYLDEASKYLSAVVWSVDQDIISGGGAQIITYYYSNGESHSITVFGDQINADDNRRYLVEARLDRPTEYDEKRMAFTQYTNDIHAVAADNAELEFFIDNFFEIEFVKWPAEEGYVTTQALFVTKGYYEGIEIFAPNRFVYRGEMYKILSEENFAKVFEWYDSL